MLTAIQTPRPGETIPVPFHPFVLAGSACPTCGLATVCATCHRCHYCKDIDLPCFGFQQRQRALIIPLRSFSRYTHPLALLADGLLEPEPEDYQGNDQEEQPRNLVQPDLPTDFDHLTDEELADWICRLIVQASCLSRLGTYAEDGDSPVTPVACRASFFSKSLEGGAT